MSDTQRTLRELSDSLQGHPGLPADARELFARLVDIVEPLETPEAPAEGAQG
jgi:hypothetical protein